MFFATNSTLLVERIPYQGSPWKFWKPYNRTFNLHCEMCRWPCATG